MGLRSAWRAVVRLGAEYGASAADQKRIILINAVSLIGLAASVAALSLRRFGSDRLGAGITLWAILWLSGVLYLHRIGKIWLAALAFSLVSALAIDVQMLVAGPVYYGGQLYLLPSTLLPFLVFSSQHTRTAVLVSLVSGASYLLSITMFNRMAWYAADLRAHAPIFVSANMTIAAMFVVIGYFSRSITSAAEKDIERERRRSERVLFSAIPASIVQRLKRGETRIAKRFGDVSVLFCRIADFTTVSAGLTSQEQLKMLDDVVTLFDELCEKHQISKIKTIGDCYMAACGLPEPREDHAEVLVAFALEMKAQMSLLRERRGRLIELRIGINSGPVVAGVIGKKKLTYDLWGDVVNTAQRMESHGAAGEVHVTSLTYTKINHRFRCAARLPIEVKGKGLMQTYFVKEPFES